jgi:hypothetical protein
LPPRHIIYIAKVGGMRTDTALKTYEAIAHKIEGLVRIKNTAEIPKDERRRLNKLLNELRGQLILYPE